MLYRSYYYDKELGAYYLQSRYYKSDWCRFINSDLPSIARICKDFQNGLNLFAYCSNEPADNFDYTGMLSTRTVIKTSVVSVRTYNFSINKNISFKTIKNMLEIQGLKVAIVGVVAMFIPEPTVSKVVGGFCTISGAIIAVLGFLLGHTNIGSKTIHLNLTVKGQIKTIRTDYTVYSGKKIIRRYSKTHKEYHIMSIGGSITW